MLVKAIVDEDFVNYRKPSMFIAANSCTFKCEEECGEKCCQNSTLASQPDIEVSISDLVDRYIANDITKAVVFGGLEPALQKDDIVEFVRVLRNERNNEDDVVIYTGYYPIEKEAFELFKELDKYKNIVAKFGRYKPNGTPIFDGVLGVELASDNQFGERIS